MRVISTNTGKAKSVIWNGKTKHTGIYKKPTSEPIYLGKTDVTDDDVIDRKHHGGIDKACYVYGGNHYDFWKEKHPNLDWHFGIFGENITLSNLDETKLHIGDIFEVGEAIVQITQPRLPCSKLGIRFGTQAVLKAFFTSGYSGIYLKVLQEGKVQVGDSFYLTARKNGTPTVADVFSLFGRNKDNTDIKEAILQESLLPESFKSLLK